MSGRGGVPRQNRGSELSTFHNHIAVDATSWAGVSLRTKTSSPSTPMKSKSEFVVLIKGGAYGSNKSRGDLQARDDWREKIKAATAGLPKFKQSCRLTLYFSLPPDRFPKDYPFGPALDNITDLVFDALGETVFSELPGKDSSVTSLTVHKMKAERADEVGLLIMASGRGERVLFSFGKDKFPECLRRVEDFEMVDWG